MVLQESVLAKVSYQESPHTSVIRVSYQECLTRVRHKIVMSKVCLKSVIAIFFEGIPLECPSKSVSGECHYSVLARVFPKSVIPSVIYKSVPLECCETMVVFVFCISFLFIAEG